MGDSSVFQHVLVLFPHLNSSMSLLTLCSHAILRQSFSAADSHVQVNDLKHGRDSPFTHWWPGLVHRSHVIIRAIICPNSSPWRRCSAGTEHSVTADEHGCMRRGDVLSLRRTNRPWQQDAFKAFLFAFKAVAGDLTSWQTTRLWEGTVWKCLLKFSSQILQHGVS